MKIKIQVNRGGGAIAVYRDRALIAEANTVSGPGALGTDRHEVLRNILQRYGCFVKGQRVGHKVTEEIIEDLALYAKAQKEYDIDAVKELLALGYATKYTLRNANYFIEEYGE